MTVFGIGLAELLIIVVGSLVLFGAPAVIGFWLGYRAGKKASDGDE